MKTSLKLLSVAVSAVFALGAAGSLSAQDAKARIAQSIDARATHYGEVAQQIWDFAEVGYLERQSTALLQEQLADAISALGIGVSVVFLLMMRTTLTCSMTSKSAT